MTDSDPSPPDPPPPHPIELTDLAERVRRLEALVTGGPSGEPEAVGPAADTFWVLEGLEQRVGRRAIAYAGSLVRDDGPVRWQLTHDTDQLMELDWTTLAPALSALGHPARLLILQLIARGEATTAADLADTPGLGSTGQIYHHLRQLVGTGWLRSTTKGRHEVPPERLVPLLVVLAASTA